VSEARDLITSLAADLRVQAAIRAGITVACCPAFPSLAMASTAADGTGIAIGAQTCHHATSGAHTGDVSPSMLVDAGCSCVIIGHSERRRDHGETDSDVVLRTTAALGAGLRPIVCVGETLDERDNGSTMDVVGRQVRAVLEGVAGELANIVVAYEPVWAIGTGRAASPSQAQEVHAHIAAIVAGRGLDLPILYGGSVTAENAAELFLMPHIAGGLVGGASLKVDGFAGIVAAAHAVSGAAS
jgi:triosephosphate isomerase (TIM)